MNGWDKCTPSLAARKKKGRIGKSIILCCCTVELSLNLSYLTDGWLKINYNQKSLQFCLCIIFRIKKNHSLYSVGIKADTICVPTSHNISQYFDCKVENIVTDLCMLCWCDRTWHFIAHTIYCVFLSLSLSYAHNTNHRDKNNNGLFMN